MSQYETEIRAAVAHYEEVLRGQLARVEAINAAGDAVDYETLDKITIGICGGDGIGPIITASAQAVLENLLSDEVRRGRIVFKKLRSTGRRGF